MSSALLVSNEPGGKLVEGIHYDLDNVFLRIFSDCDFLGRTGATVPSPKGLGAYIFVAVLFCCLSSVCLAELGRIWLVG